MDSSSSSADGYWKVFLSPTQAYWAGAISLETVKSLPIDAGPYHHYVQPQEKVAIAETTPSKRISTYALSTGQSVAGLSETIPILFGKRTTTSGGLVIAPNAIYQRMHSEGVYEWLRAAYVIGEGGIVLGVPGLRGIRLGSTVIDSKDINYWSFLVTNGSTADNDPTASNTTIYGTFEASSNLTGAGEFLTGTINRGEVRCFSQVIDSDQTFGFSGEEPDCDGEPAEEASSTITPVSLNPIQAFITNTRSCEVTEIGLAAALASNPSNKNDTAPPGSMWTNSTGTLVYRVVSTGTYISSSYPSDYRTNLTYKNYLDSAYANAQRAWDEGTRYLQRLDPDTLVPIPIAILSDSDFLEEIGVDYLPYTDADRNRNTTPATGYALPAPDACALPDFTQILSDPNNPKMAFHIYWRSATNASSDAWRQLTTQPLIIACVDSTVMFSTLKLQHPSFSAVQYKIEPVLPDDFGRNYLQYETFYDGTTTSYQAESKGSFPIIYSRNAPIQNIDLSDGFKLEYKGGYDSFYGEVTLDDQTVNYAVGINYINEIIQDSPNYPYMSTAVLNLRGFKGMTSTGQLSLYYDDGAEIYLLETGSTGTSNMFPELANYLLTTFPGGTGAVPASSIDTESFLKAITFTRANSLFFDGIITEKSGAFEFIAEHAEFFLLRFGMNQGKYAFTIATQDSSTGTSTATATQVLTMDDIIADSYSVEYKTLQDREEAFINVTYRVQEQYMLGEDRTVTVAPAGYTGSNIISYDLSDFCTTENHAVTYARFALATRLKQTHGVSFTTFLGRINLSPGRLFTFNLSVTTSLGSTYTNTEQYQVVSTVYQPDGTVSVQAIHAPTDLSSVVFSNTYSVVT